MPVIRIVVDEKERYEQESEKGDIRVEMGQGFVARFVFVVESVKDFLFLLYRLINSNKILK